MNARGGGRSSGAVARKVKETAHAFPDMLVPEGHHDRVSGCGGFAPEAEVYAHE